MDQAMPSNSLKSATYLFSEQLRLMVCEPIFAEGTSYSHEVMDTLCRARSCAPCHLHRHIGMVQTVYRAVFRAAFIHPGRETRALVPGCIDRALQTFSPLWTAWTLTILKVLATVLTSRSATQSVRTTYRWSGKASLHLMPARGPLKNESGRSLSRRWSAARLLRLLRQFGLLTSPFILWAFVVAGSTLYRCTADTC
jgi:hypothetical protein